MIVCPNCSHQNPDGAVQCEACYTDLPQLAQCPSCHAQIQTDASFCGQCGYDLRSNKAAGNGPLPPTQFPATPASPIVSPEVSPEVSPPPPPPPEPVVVSASPSLSAAGTLPESFPEPLPAPSSSRTQLQQQVARLIHVQTDTSMELPPGLPVIHLGKPNDRIPPDIDVSGFPNSEIVSRVHADIRVDADAYYLEDTGSANGTYVNNIPLPMGNRHRLRPGDRIALGKGDKVSFIFQISS
ncbi:FHA domain-containing protein [Leptolyngbya sp. FACHB-261]|uniref:FHA domain-containing protein n=1 Tax=Leptolyngbya sp. FACHB-261 TaxID=2692806 RepID=UPI001689B561|nr:FHA domain-containing protein [Leptolyngbya sp. FACHB-261]MBD2104596.1 FHA domain-containing protein [Leptolyngbya sp. FACHB-261]